MLCWVLKPHQPFWEIKVSFPRRVLSHLLHLINPKREVLGKLIKFLVVLFIFSQLREKLKACFHNVFLGNFQDLALLGHSQEMFWGRSSETTTLRLKLKYLGISSLQLSRMNTWQNTVWCYACCFQKLSKGSCQEVKSSALNSNWPSTEKAWFPSVFFHWWGSYKIHYIPPEWCH